MTFDNPTRMKWRFTYKELSLVLGIMVAMIILLTLWLKPLSNNSSGLSIKPEFPKKASVVRILTAPFKTYF